MQSAADSGRRGEGPVPLGEICSWKCWSFWGVGVGCEEGPSFLDNGGMACHGQALVLWCHYIPTIGNTLVAQEREDYGQGLKQDASSDRNCVDQIRFTLYERARLVTHTGQVCADRSIGRGTAAQRESPPAVLCGDQALLPTSAHSIGFCVIRVCISSSSSSGWRSRGEV